MRALARFHDRLTAIGAWLSAAGVAAIVLSFCFEVISRYLFNAPTSWVGAITVYLLLVCTMLMFPFITRERSHVTITFLLERVGPEAARWLAASCVLVSAVVCLLSVWFTGTETHRQLVGGTTMVDELMVTPKWLLSAFICYGFASSSIYFLRQLREAFQTGRVTADIGIGE
jgi:TRAP-type C4-dicarboxylate transport system permease small subunit